ncbi:hypothetical protein [Natrarchaeobaculum aegyptiacum]|uniref:Uncharacterized protein n=1 Tax=Natrarchaeobaculum aegyptiacum TaxID=745377 RepID=A0A2Z2HVX4_9EURY|nr:hypothetical protein [Natrarchaeobaculum aegyptiacum]ARS89687.1 hypothetical protein B1756_07995 [Natrarchaeobaculum aegyptiacum]
MRRRAFISLAAVVPLAGCSGLLGGGVEETISDEELVEFEADDGAELTVTVDVVEVDDLDLEDEMDGLEREGVGIRIDRQGAGPIETRTVHDSETFELTVDDGGTHTVMIIGGTADVTIE